MTKALVIDDEKMILDMIKMVLLKLNFDVETANCGASGIKKFDTENFDLVITDICMPVVDGKAVIRHIRRTENNHTPVIGISGTPWKLKELDFDEVLAKPFPLKTLMDTVTSLTSHHQYKN